MITTQIHDVTISVPKSRFGDVDNFIMEYIKESYEGKCVNGYFVQKIIDVPVRGHLSIDNSDLKANGVVSAQFQYHAVRPLYGEFLANCEVVAIHDKSVNAIKDMISVYVELPNDKHKWIKVGSKIPIVVNHIVANNGDDMIQVVGQILEDFENPLHNAIYRISKIPSVRDYDALIARIRSIRRDKKTEDTLVKLMPKFHGVKPMKGLVKHDLSKSIPEFKENLVVQFPSVATDNIYISHKIDTENIPVVSDDILLTYLENRLSYLTGVLDLAGQTGKSLKQII